MIGQFAKIGISTLVMPLNKLFPKRGYKSCFSGVVPIAEEEEGNTLSPTKDINGDSNDNGNGKDCFSRKGFPPPY